MQMINILLAISNESRDMTVQITYDYGSLTVISLQFCVTCTQHRLTLHYGAYLSDLWTTSIAFVFVTVA